MEIELDRAISFRKNGEYEKSNKLLVKLVELHPDSGKLNYHCAWSFDLLGEERKAVAYYEAAIKLGLSSEELEGAYLGLGSTYRILGEYEKSEKTFLKGMEAFPDNRALQTFYSMTLYNLKEYDKAMELLLKCLTDTTADDKILNYKKAIEFYSNKLDETWK